LSFHERRSWFVIGVRVFVVGITVQILSPHKRWCGVFVRIRVVSPWFVPSCFVEVALNVANRELRLDFVTNEVGKKGLDAGSINRLMVAVVLIAQNVIVFRLIV
jgi:hypothetical protein